MPRTWYTHPPHEFDSFYYFDESTRKFVRIRLELHRRDGSGDTKAMYMTYRYVGFSSYDDLDARDPSKWTVVKGDIVYDGTKTLRTQPEVGDWIYDFTLEPGEKNPKHVHNGNTYLTDGDRPPGITEEDLVELAKLAIKEGQDIFLTGKNATAKELSNAILTKIGKRVLA